MIIIGTVTIRVELIRIVKIINKSNNAKKVEER